MISIPERETARGQTLFAALLRGLPRAYAVLFFSGNGRLGWWLLAISLLSPDLGLVGLAGAVAAGALAWALGYDRSGVRNGYLLFNPLLVCLTLAFLHRCYHFEIQTYVLLWCASVVGGFFVSVAMQTWVGFHFGISAHSLPAMLVVYVLYFLGYSLFGIAVLPYEASSEWLDPSFLPPFVQSLFQAFGAMLFQPHVTPGILVFIGLALTSPLSTLMATMAFVVGATTLARFGIPLGPEGITWCGFNFLLTGIALGTGYFIPSGASLLLAAAGVFLCALTSLALAAGLRYFGLPASALPYNLVVLALVYALRQRCTAGALHPSPAPGALPESLARHELINARRFPHLKTPALALPCAAERTVTQAFHGALTHRGAWSYALDFEGEHTQSAELADYAIWDTPVLSPCAGWVTSIATQVADNAPGANNPDENWGNYVLIYSDAGFTVMLAHLKKESITVALGQRVWIGTPLGLCGNSGRSPVPHLHLHVQTTAQLGAPTRPFVLKHYIEHGEQPVFHVTGVPALGAHIRPAKPHAALGEALYGWLPGEYRYRITVENGATWEETFVLDFDESGNYRLRSRRCEASLTAFLSEGVFYITNFIGNDHSLLATIAVGLARVPCIAEPAAVWHDDASTAPFFTSAARWFRDLIEPFFGPFLARYTYCLREKAGTFAIHATAAKSARLPAHAPREITCTLAGRRGILALESHLFNGRTLRAELLAPSH